MRHILVIAALSTVVVAAWLGALGFARLRQAIDRLHCVAFVNAVSGLMVALASVLTDGISIRFAKVLMIVGVNLLFGAAVSHVTGRAILERTGGRP